MSGSASYLELCHGLVIGYRDLRSISHKVRKIAPSMCLEGLPWWLSDKESACNAGNPGSIPGLGRSPGAGHGNPLQYSCLENPMDRGAWHAVVRRVAQSDTTEAAKQ